MDIIASINKLRLPARSYVVVGSSVLVTLGLAESDSDVDLTVTQAVFDGLKQQGWEQSTFGNVPILKQDIYDVGVYFYRWNVEELLYDALWVDNVPFICLEKLLEWKKYMQRTVDIAQIKRIETYLRQQKTRH